VNPIRIISIRFATIADAEAIAKLLFESFAEFEARYTSEGFRATAITGAQVAIRISEGPVWVAILDDEVVGTASAIAKDESLYVRGMAVHPNARGRRVGELLLIQIENFAIRNAFDRLSLSTTPFLDCAIRLYQRFGFHRVSTGPRDLFGTPLFSMEKTLEGAK
jgi:ribosomal protein S18 acetylase RimI-like enzyme